MKYHVYCYPLLSFYKYFCIIVYRKPLITDNKKHYTIIKLSYKNFLPCQTHMGSNWQHCQTAIYTEYQHYIGHLAVCQEISALQTF